MASVLASVIGTTFHRAVDGVAVTATASVRRLQVAHQFHQIASIVVQLQIPTNSTQIRSQTNAQVAPSILKSPSLDYNNYYYIHLTAFFPGQPG